MTKIFISYRRDDAEADAGRLYDHLSKVFNPNDIFFDHQSIDEGDDFKQVIGEAIAQVRVFIAVINKGWLSATDEDKNQRIHQDDDVVRWEIKCALEKEGVTFIPLLIGDTRMPKSKELPEDLRLLATKSAGRLNHKYFAKEVSNLADIIKRKVEPVTKTQNERDYGQEIINEYNNWFGMEYVEDGHKKKFYYGSDTAKRSFNSSHIILEAIEELIENANIDWWVKHEDELRPEEFWGRILKSLVISCRIGHTGENLDEYSDADIIRWFLPDLEGINSLWLKSNAYKISQRVADAFPDVPPPSVDKLMSEYWDEDPEVTAAFRGRHWTSITHEQAEQFSSQFMMFSPKIAKIYLPAFLMASLKKRGELAQIIFDTLSPTKELVPAKQQWIAELVKHLNYHQINSIHQFIEWCEEEVLFSLDEEDQQTIKYWEKLASK